MYVAATDASGAAGTTLTGSRPLPSPAAAVRQLNANLIAEGGINEPKSEGKPTLLGRLMGA